MVNRAKGVIPDIPVANLPVESFHGTDKQLDAAIREVLKEIKASPDVKIPEHPQFPMRAHTTTRSVWRTNEKKPSCECNRTEVRKNNYTYTHSRRTETEREREREREKKNRTERERERERERLDVHFYRSVLYVLPPRLNAPTSSIQNVFVFHPPPKKSRVNRLPPFCYIRLCFMRWHVFFVVKPFFSLMTFVLIN